MGNCGIIVHLFINIHDRMLLIGTIYKQGDILVLRKWSVL